jgi:dihydropteroate synthase
VGIVNVTPDSFYDGGRHGNGVNAAEAMLEAGADWIDVGGESTRPGAEPVDAETEWARVQPVIEAFARTTAVSIDTHKAVVAARAIKAGARVINDVSALSDPLMAAVTADAEATVVMHMRGTPENMGALTHYEHLIDEVTAWLVERAAQARSRTVWIDPGIGFAKTAQQSLSLLHHTDVLVATGLPVLIGASRKSFIGHTLGIDHADERLSGSLAAVATAWTKGAKAFRVHDVAQTRQMLDMLCAIQGAA